MFSFYLQKAWCHVAFSAGPCKTEVTRDKHRAWYKWLYTVSSYQQTQPTFYRPTASHLKAAGLAAVWFVCVVGAADRSHEGSNCLMVGFMETLYNAPDSLFSACQEDRICDTTMAGALVQPRALMLPLLTALRGEVTEEDWNVFSCSLPQRCARYNMENC